MLRKRVERSPGSMEGEGELLERVPLLYDEVDPLELMARLTREMDEKITRCLKEQRKLISK